MDSTEKAFYGFGIFFIIIICLIPFIALIIFYPQLRILLYNTIIVNIYNFFIYIGANINAGFRNEIIFEDNCAIIPNTGESSITLPSAYLAHIAFFLGFLFTNAYNVYKMDDTSHSLETNNRKSRTAMIMAIIIVFYLIIIIGRYRVTNCESPFGILFTTLMFSTLGYAFNKLADACGARNSDILGITTSIISSEAKAPIVCASSTAFT